MTFPNTLKKAFPYLIQSQLGNHGKGFNKELYKYCSYKEQFLTQRAITGIETCTFIINWILKGFNCFPGPAKKRKITISKFPVILRLS